MFLNKWLDYCLDRGHRFEGSSAGVRFAPHEPA
jgi:hypothetical protein